MYWAWAYRLVICTAAWQPISCACPIYLVYAEAKMGLATSTTDQSALDAFNAVRGRAIPGVTPKTSITWEDVWKERRLELACEGDRWYDYVRLAYYDSQRAINELKAQRRDVYYSLGTT